MSADADNARRDDFTRKMMSNLDGELHQQITSLQAEITKLRAERDAATERIGVLQDDIIALARQNEKLTLTSQNGGADA